jgi:hypothetical protein
MSKYLTNGQEVELIGPFQGQFLVRTVLQDYEGNDLEGTLELVAQVLDQPPTAKIGQELVELSAKCDAVAERKRELEAQIREVEAANQSRFLKFKQYKQLALLEDFLDGKITHYVIERYNRIQILPLENTKTEYHRDALRLLVLYGLSKGDLEWRLCYYADGSGSYETVYPVTSLEAAKQQAREIALDNICATKDNPQRAVIDSATYCGVDVPAEYRQAVEARESADREQRRTALQSELSKLDAPSQPT